MSFPQKPEKLLERIVLASSNPGDLVLDPFCGYGTTAAVCSKNDRRWITIDLGPQQIEISKRRLEKINTIGLNPFKVLTDANLVEDVTKYNYLIHGECLDVMKILIAKGIRVDLIYADPPFNTGQRFDSGFVDKFPSIKDYMAWLRPRSEAMRDILKDTGSLYHHCDYRTNAHVRLMLDEVLP